MARSSWSVGSLSAADASLKVLADAVLHGKTPEALEAVEGALGNGHSIEDLVVNGILSAHLKFGEWYERDSLGAVKAWEFCYFTTVKVLKVLDSRIPAPPDAAPSVFVGTVKGEGHVTMRDVITSLLKAKGLRVYSSKKGITLEELKEPLADRALKAVVLSCTESGTKPALETLIKGIRSARPDIKVIAGGQFAGEAGADIVLSDPLRLYDTIMALNTR